jgi:hypothetical protein
MVDARPKFEVHKLEGKAMKRIATPKVEMDDKGKPKLDKDGNKKLLGGFDYHEVEVDAGWMVYFPSGSSIRVWTQEELERQGFDNSPPLVDMDTGDIVGQSQVGSLKAKSDQVANRGRKQQVSTPVQQSGE